MDDWVMDIVKQFEAVPAWSWCLQFISLISQFVGAELNARRKIVGFYILMFANITLIIIHFTSSLWVLLILDLLYLRINIRGVRHWGSLNPASVGPVVRKIFRF